MTVELHNTELLEVPNNISKTVGYPIIREKGKTFILITSSKTPNLKSTSDNMSGGSGQVFKIQNIDNQEFVAKSNKPTSHNPIHTTTLESQILASLRHPNIVSCQGYTSTNGVPPDQREIFYLMEHCKQTLEQQIPYFQKISSVIKIAIQTANALSYMHSKDFVHGDLNARNIFLDENDNAKVGDLGITRHLFGLKKIIWEQIGTEGYSAPEQYSGIFSPKNDSYSLGAVLHQMLTRTSPEIMPPFGAYENLLNKRPFCQCFMNELGDTYENMRETLVLALNPNPNERITVEAIRQKLLLMSIKNPSILQTLSSSQLLPNQMDEKKP